MLGRLNLRVVSLALTCALAFAGGLRIVNAGNNFADTPSPTSKNPASCNKQRDATKPVGRRKRGRRKSAAFSSTPPAPLPAAKQAASREGFAMAAVFPGSIPTLETAASWIPYGSGSTAKLTLHREAARPRDNGSAPAPVPAGPPAAGPEKGWTPAAYVNSRLPHWLRMSGQFRNRDEAPTAYGLKPGNNDAYALTRTVLEFDATSSSWVHAFVQARDAEVIGVNPKNVTSSIKDAFDLDQAYVELRTANQGWFSLQAGRQQMFYGDERLIGRSDWSNASRSFDAVRLRFQSKSFGTRVDLFASSVVKNYPTSLDRVLPGQNFYGINATFTELVPRTTIEPYLYVKTLPSVKGIDKLRGNERLYTSGFRLNGALGGGFDYKLRYSFQSGHLADDPIHAMGGYGVLGYTIPKTRLQPRFSIEYAYASGNKTMGDRVIGTFDQLYPTTHGQRGITDLFAEENIKDLKPAFDFKPWKNTNVVFMANRLSLASLYDGLYDAHSEALIVKVPNGGALSPTIGTEVDIYGSYPLNQRLHLGAGFGHLYAGPFLKENTAGASVTYPYVSLDYHF